MKRKYNILIACFLSGLLLSGVAVWWGLYQVPADRSGAIWIERGDPADKALLQLPAVWQHPVPQLLSRLFADGQPFQAGYYRFTTGDTLAPMLQRFHHGDSNEVAVTVTEGMNMFEVAALLDRAQVTRRHDFLKACMRKKDLRKLLGVPANRCEGYLFPDTYYFRPFQPGTTVRNTMIKLFQKKTRALFDHYSLSASASIYRVVTLASIVEKETGLASERPVIASVFLNRIFRHMRLQSDPTTIYGIWNRFDGNLRRSDLQEKTAYNTYRINGLPPTPIANPGLAAIEAVLRPAVSDYLYFVADGSGGHKFSVTHRQHINAVNRYQKKKRHLTR